MANPARPDPTYADLLALLAVARPLRVPAAGGFSWRSVCCSVDAGSFDDTETARIAPFEAVEVPIGRLFLPRPQVPE